MLYRFKYLTFKHLNLLIKTLPGSEIGQGILQP
jgi:hypothetical protein